VDRGGRDLAHYFKTFKQFRCVGTLQTFFGPLMWGPIFVGAPVRPNMLNMPKSASVRQIVIGV